MKKLERVFQDKDGYLTFEDGTDVDIWETEPIGKIKTLVVKGPCANVNELIEKMHERKDSFIPEYAEVYVVSDTNPNTRHIKKDGEQYSVYAVQFFMLPETV